MVLQDEDHPWVPVCEKVISGYQFQRDDMVNKLYDKDCTEAIHTVEAGVVTALMKFFDELGTEDFDVDLSNPDFAAWAEELEGDE